MTDQLSQIQILVINSIIRETCFVFERQEKMNYNDAGTGPAITKQMIHSTSVNTLSRKGLSSGLVPQEPSSYHQRTGQHPQQPTIFSSNNRFSPSSAPHAHNNATQQHHYAAKPQQHHNAHQQQHSQSTANLATTTSASLGSKVTMGLHHAQQADRKDSQQRGATAASYQMNSRANNINKTTVGSGSNVGIGQRNESPSVAQSNNPSSSTILSLTNAPKTAAQQQQQSSQPSTSNKNSRHTVKMSGLTSATNSASNNMLHTISHTSGKDRYGSSSVKGSLTSGHGTLKQTKSFTQSMENMHQMVVQPQNSSAVGNGSQKPPSSGKQQQNQQPNSGSFSQNTRTIESKHSSHQRDKAQESFTHMRSQASLGFKQHQIGPNLISSGNSRSQHKQHESHSYNNKASTSSLVQKRGSETTDLEKQRGSSFAAKQPRMSQQINSTSTQPSLQSRLTTHKTSSVCDLKKPVSLSSHPIPQLKSSGAGTTSSQALQSMMPNSQQTPTSSQIVSAHSYQATANSATPSSAHNTSSTIGLSINQKSLQGHNISQTPTSTSVKSHKPPLVDSTKHGHSISLHNTTATNNNHNHPTNSGQSVSVSQHRQSVGGLSSKKTSLSSPQNQLHAFTKKQSHDVQATKSQQSSVSNLLGSAKGTSFSQTANSLANNFQPQLNTGGSVVSSSSTSAHQKRKSRDIKQSNQVFPTSSKSASLHGQQNNGSSNATRVSTNSLKNQITQQAKDREQKKTHQQSSTSVTQNQLKSRNQTAKISMSGGQQRLNESSKSKAQSSTTAANNNASNSGLLPRQQSHSESNNNRQQSSHSGSKENYQHQYDSNNDRTKKHHHGGKTTQSATAGGESNSAATYPRSSSQSIGYSQSQQQMQHPNSRQQVKEKTQSNSFAAPASSSGFSAKQQQHQGTTNSMLDRFKDKHSKISAAQSESEQQSKNGTNTQYQAQGSNKPLSKPLQHNNVPSILNAYKQRSGSPPDPISSLKPTSQSQQLQQKNINTSSNSSKVNTFATQMSQKLAVSQNRIPSQQSSKPNNQDSSADERYNRSKEQQVAQTSSVNHSHKMGAGTANNAIFQRKVRSATRAQEMDSNIQGGGSQQTHSNAIGVKGSHNNQGVHALNSHHHAASSSNLGQTHFQHHKLSQQKITDRPSSASAGQKFIGRQQNLKELFEKNWQSVNVQNKVDPQSGEAHQIRTLTVVDTNSMVHEDQQEAATLDLAPGTRIIIPNHEPTKCSNKRNGIVRAYAANTNQGLVRNYNEDRVSIILNIVKPEHRKHETWPTCSFFGVYDGHGGSACAEFLRDNLHHYVIKEESFPWEPEEAIRKGFEKAESRFLDMCQAKDESTGQMQVIERSGSCAIVVLIVGEICYVANVGDSRAVLSSEGGSQMTALSRDHKPSDTDEYKRIIQAGGQIYQTTTSQILNQKEQLAQQQKEGKVSDPEFIVGPIRVLPGRLSVCRTFGDPEAKLQFRGGNINVVQAIPDIRTFQISKQHDFIALASDGIFDKLTDDDLGKAVWLTCEAARQAKSTLSAGAQAPQVKSESQANAANSISVHQYCGLGVEGILKNSLMRQSLDNVTVVMVAFHNFKRVACGPSLYGTAEKTRENRQHSSSTKKQPLQSSEALGASASGSKIGKGSEQENINYMSNGNKTAAARSQQQLLSRNPNSIDQRNQPHEQDQQRQLTRQAGGDHQLPRQSKQYMADQRLSSNNTLPRTRSQNQDSLPQEQDSSLIANTYSIRHQQQQATKQQSSGQFSAGNNNSSAAAGGMGSFIKSRPSTDQIDHRNNSKQHHQYNKANGNYAPSSGSDNLRQQTKPPMSSNIGPSGTQSKPQQAKQSHHTTQLGMRSHSLKEVTPLHGGSSLTSAKNNIGPGSNVHGRLNQLANLNSNKSLGVIAGGHSHSQFNQTPTTQQSSVKSGSPAITMQHQHQSTGSSSANHHQHQQYRHLTGGSSSSKNSRPSPQQQQQMIQPHNHNQLVGDHQNQPLNINHRFGGTGAPQST